jgi:hypothetical protein
MRAVADVPLENLKALQKETKARKNRRRPPLKN